MTARPGDAPPLIAVTDACLDRGGRRLLSGVTLHLDDARIGIVGRNGSGKTTLARVLCGLVPVDSGQVRIAGVDVVADRRAAVATVGILFQNPDHQIIFPTVAEELSFGLRQIGQTAAQAAAGVDAILGTFDKAHWRDAATHHLSQGQKQLVCLMAVMAMKPRLIVLDEPFSGLDIPTRMQLQRVLDRIDAAVVHISHDPEVLRGYDRVIWIDDGCVRQAGAAGPVLDAYGAAMVQRGGGDDLTHL